MNVFDSFMLDWAWITWVLIVVAYLLWEPITFMHYKSKVFKELLEYELTKHPSHLIFDNRFYLLFLFRARKSPAQAALCLVDSLKGRRWTDVS